MKYAVDCPDCGSARLIVLLHETYGRIVECQKCFRQTPERALLRHMQTKHYIRSDAPAFRVLDIKPKGRSSAAKTVFGH